MPKIKMHRNIRGKKVPYQLISLPVSELNYYADNPRIGSIVIEIDQESMGWEATQTKIDSIMRTRAHVRELKKQIVDDGGLSEKPIVMKDEHGRCLVVEGNSRLAALHMIRDDDKCSSEIKDALVTIDVELFTERLAPETLVALLSDLHLTGKTQWDAYEKAFFATKRYNEVQNFQTVAREIGSKSSDVKCMVSTIELMNKTPNSDTGDYSRFHVVKSNKNCQNLCKKIPELEGKFVEEIQHSKEEGDREAATTFRQKLGNIVSHEKVAKTFAKGDKTFSEAATETSPANVIKQHIKRAREYKVWLNEAIKPKSNKFHENPPSKDDLKALSFQVKKLCEILEKYQKVIDGLKPEKPAN